MPFVPSISPATGEPTSSSFIHTLDCNFVDNAGRTLLLRGVNLSGSSKAPVDKPSYVLDGFWETAESGGESFIGRPLNLDDGSADIHLARLRGWGFNMLRFPVTWESLEHEGPRKYDFEFMDYTVRVLRKCKEYGFIVYMDPHQDIWSRFSGGSGAPFWTLPACGIDYQNLTATQSAIVHCEYPTPEDPDPGSLPAMLWSTNYGRLFSQTIFTLFFAGRDFAPKCIIDGKNIQDYLQEHYIEAMGQMADRIRDAGDLLDVCVIGWDSMNEPFEGLCGWADLNVSPTAQGSTLRKGTYPSPAQSLRLGMGQAQTVDNFKFGTFGPSRDGSVTIEPNGRKLWCDPSIEGPDGVHPKWGWKRDPMWLLGTCIWAQHGVWDIESGYILRPDYFRYLPDTHPTSLENPDNLPTPIEFVQDYWRPHWELFSTRIRMSHPECIMFVQPPVFAPPPPIGDDFLKGRAAYSGHFYDGLTLVTRHWNWFNADALGLLRGHYSSPFQALKVGETAIRKSLQEQLGMLKEDTTIIGPYPTLIGEIGIPYDMDDKRSYGWTDKGKHKGDYSRQERALDASLNAADGTNAINWTIWTYCPDSCHDWGDGWNMEDLSLWSEDDLRARKNHMAKEDLQNLYNIDDDNSRAVLLRKKKSFEAMGLKGAAAVSSFSLATIGMGAGGGALFDEIMEHQRVEQDLSRWKDNPYDFLTDGARAVRAFARPWPTKVVGRSTNIQFDINNAYFKLVVGVRPEDKLKEGGVDEENPGTEVYVPLVHFADPRFLVASTDEDHTRTLDSTHTTTTGSSGKASQMGSRNASVLNLESLHKVTHSLSTTSSTDMRPSLSDKNMLDVDVSVSEGTWEVEGQMLKWWYPVPEEGEPERQYTLEIRRTGGAIKSDITVDDNALSWTNICGDSCTVM